MIYHQQEHIIKLYFDQKKCRIITWFYPEINRINPALISIARKEISYHIPSLFEVNENEEKILEIMNSGYSNEELSKIIREDDIDSLIALYQNIVLILISIPKSNQHNTNDVQFFRMIHVLFNIQPFSIPLKYLSTCI